MCSWRTRRTSSNFAVSGTATTFVRGTMISRTVLSPNSSTLWRSRLSSPWISSFVRAQIDDALHLLFRKRRGPSRGCRAAAACRSRTGRTRRRPARARASSRPWERRRHGRSRPARRRRSPSGVISPKTKRATVEKTTATAAPRVAPSQAVANSVAMPKPSLLKRFWPIRIVARRRDVCDLRFRMSAALRSPFSRIRCRSMARKRHECGLGGGEESGEPERKEQKKEEQPNFRAHAPPPLFRRRPSRADGQPRVRPADGVGEPAVARVGRPAEEPGGRSRLRRRPRRSRRCAALRGVRRGSRPWPRTFVATPPSRSPATRRASEPGSVSGEEGPCVPGADLLTHVAAEHVLADL